MVCSYVFLMASKMSCDLVLFIVTFLLRSEKVPLIWLCFCYRVCYDFCYDLSYVFSCVFCCNSMFVLRVKRVVVCGCYFVLQGLLFFNVDGRSCKLPFVCPADLVGHTLDTALAMRHSCHSSSTITFIGKT